MDEQLRESLLAQVRAAAASNVFEFYCRLYCDTVELFDGETFVPVGWRFGPDRRGARRTVTLDWEDETVDGYKVSSYPVFEVDPPCPGVWTHEHDDEPRPETCPFHEHFGDIAPEVEEILAMSRERKRFRAILEGRR